MAVGWFRQLSDDKLVSTADSEMTAPTGHDFILKSTIEAVYDGEIWQLGTWKVTAGVGVYTPPVDIITPFDPTSTGRGCQRGRAHSRGCL